MDSMPATLRGFDKPMVANSERGVCALAYSANQTFNDHVAKVGLQKAISPPCNHRQRLPDSSNKPQVHTALEVSVPSIGYFAPGGMA